MIYYMKIVMAAVYGPLLEGGTVAKTTRGNRPSILYQPV